jgi:hypothetical protein
MHHAEEDPNATLSSTFVHAASSRARHAEGALDLGLAPVQRLGRRYNIVGSPVG